MNRISSSFPVGRPVGALTPMSELRSGSRRRRRDLLRRSVVALPGAIGGVPFLVALVDAVLPVLGGVGGVERSDPELHTARLAGRFDPPMVGAPVVLRGF